MNRPGHTGPNKERGNEMKTLLISLVICAIAVPAMAANVEEAETDEIAQPSLVLYPGDYYSFYSALYGPCLFGRDLWPFLTVGQGTLTVEVEDCCSMGDSLFADLRWFWHGIVDYGYVTSPTTITLESSAYSLGLFVAKVCYVHSIGGYPAGYYLDVSFE